MLIRTKENKIALKEMQTGQIDHPAQWRKMYDPGRGAR